MWDPPHLVNNILTELTQLSCSVFEKRCRDFRKLNAVTRANLYSLPRIEDCTDCVGKEKYVTSERVLADNSDLRNIPATFQRLINQMVGGLEGCEAYIHTYIVTHGKFYCQDFQRPTLQLNIYLVTQK